VGIILNDNSRCTSLSNFDLADITFNCTPKGVVAEFKFPGG